MSGARYIARLKRLRSVPGRGRIVAALRDSDDPYLSEVHQKVAERMSLCMCGATVMGEADGSRVAVGPHHCDASVCDRCHKHRRRGSYQTLLGLCQEAQRQDLLLLLVTVTFPRDPSPVAPQLADLWSAYEQLRSHEAWEPVQGAAATLEVTYRQEGARCRAGQLCKRGCRGCGRTLAHGWLPHLHIVAASESRIEWPDLGPVWEEVTEGRASIVHVRALVGDQAAEDGLQ